MNMTIQEAFDLVATKLIEQGKPSMGSDGQCMYRGPNNTRCAAGWLIPDDKYNDEMEGIALRCDNDNSVCFAIPCDLAFTTRLQDAHDTSTGSSTKVWQREWKHSMHRIASLYSLKNDVLLTEWPTNVTPTIY